MIHWKPLPQVTCICWGTFGCRSGKAPAHLVYTVISSDRTSPNIGHAGRNEKEVCWFLGILENPGHLRRGHGVIRSIHKTCISVLLNVLHLTLPPLPPSLLEVISICFQSKKAAIWIRASLWTSCADTTEGLATPKCLGPVSPSVRLSWTRLCLQICIQECSGMNYCWFFHPWVS